MVARRLAIAGSGMWALIFCCQAVLAEAGGNIWGAREPAQCPSLAATQTPGEAEAAQLVQCRKESASVPTGNLALMENVRVTIAPARPFVEYYNSYDMPDADVSHDVHPIEGSWTWFNCITMADAGLYGDPRLNCTETDVSGAAGVCWVTRGNLWQCNLAGGVSGHPRKLSSPPT